ncbi:ribonuclease H-like domain-containing protein [Desarmillaria ectypa]|nr:ribonuclease H-like domain-containing protein [Desarmillaria ectypa]
MSDSIPSAPGPSVPLTRSYTYHSSTPTAAGPYILGVDEAGRGPVLGPLVYGVAFCPVSYQDTLETMGFADSKTLTPEIRSSLLNTLTSDPANLGWSVRVISPQDISSGMLKRPPINLNQQSRDATVLLIREVIDSGIQLAEVYVDALGNTKDYQDYLSKQFTGIRFIVETKADFKFKIVGAASVGAKVTRDACIETWTFEEANYKPPMAEMGSGYPSDPNTKEWMRNCMDPVFGFPKVVRFSWATAKTILERDAHSVKWIDEGQETLIKSFQSAQGLDKDRCIVAKDLSLKSIAAL